MARFGALGTRSWMLSGIPVVLFLALALACYHCTVDDAFISFRCARNLASGNGPVFNVGERVEAFSNPLWVFMLALASLFKIDIVTAAKVIGLACGAITLVLLMRLCRRALAFSSAATLVAAVYLGTNITLVYYAISGLETVFYAMTLVLMIYLLTEGRVIAAGAAGAALALTRPEGILYVVPLAIGCRLNRCGWRRLLMILLIPIGAYGLLTSFRVLYFGALLPNSYAAKIGPEPIPLVGSTPRAAVFQQYSWNASSMQKPLLCAVFLGAFVLAGRATAPLIASVAVAAFFVWYGRGDWMSFWRFYAPVLPFFAAFWVGGLDYIRLSLGRTYRAKAFWVVLLLPLLVNGARTVRSVEALDRGEEFNPAMHSRAHARIGAYLASIGSPGDVVVVNEIGAIGYYSGCITIDMLGLSDPRVPSLLRRSDLGAYADYILSRNPTFILLNDRQRPGDRGLHPVHAAIYDGMMKTGMYKQNAEFPLNSFKNVVVFMRQKKNQRSERP
jgi:arabinofuranosyltransferase